MQLTQPTIGLFQLSHLFVRFLKSYFITNYITSLKNIAFCISINLDLGRDTPLSRPSQKLLTNIRRLWIKNWSPMVFFLTFQRHLTQLTMIFCYQNSIDMVYVEMLSDDLKTTYTIVIRLSKLVTLYLTVRPLSVVYLKGQLWVYCYVCSKFKQTILPNLC